MSGRRSTSGYKDSKLSQNKSDFEAPFQFMCDLPPVPIEPKLVNFSIPLEKSTKYKPTCLEMNQDQVFFTDLSSVLNVDLVNPKVYEKRLSKDQMQNLNPEDRELADLVLSADTTRSMKDNPSLNLTRSNSTNDLMSKLKLKRDKEKSRYSNLNNNEISMYLRHTSILTAGASKVYGQNFNDPISTVQDYEGEQFFESGEALNSDQFKKL
jgi:hypothetical protein